MRQYFLLLFIIISVLVQAQKTPPALALHLQPHRLKGGHFFHKNMAVAGFKTHRFRRTFGSFLAAPSIQPLNILNIAGIPLYHKKKRRSKDIFRFEVYHEGQPISTTETKATLYTNETFNLLDVFQAASFFGKSNVDLLEARIQLTDQPKQYWEVVATNLNGTRREEQKGVIRKDSTLIYFTRTFAVLREKAIHNEDPKSLYSSLYNVYAFTYKNEVIAAVTADERGRKKKIWFKEALPSQLKTVITNTAMTLKARRTIYK